MDFEHRELLVLALGGNALSPPQGSADDYAAERAIVTATGKILNELIAQDYRLLIVHGNGPQVGRLLEQDPGHCDLDIHIAQTQGELGYLLTAAIHEQVVAVLTSVLVDAVDAPAVKPIGPWLPQPPADGGAALHTDLGWRRLVSSPLPRRVVELPMISELIRRSHVIAGGGGGIPLDSEGRPVPGVVDKDYVASQLAVELGAAALVFATDVDSVCADFGGPEQRPISRLGCDEAADMIARGAVLAGSMAPKLDSAVEFVVRTHQPSRICHLTQITAAMAGQAGTLITPD